MGAVAVVAVAAVGLAGCTGSGSSGSCVSPSISLSSDELRPGERVTVVGDAFVHGCADTSAVVDGVVVRGEPQSPATGLAVVWGQGGRTETLATVDADARGQFSVAVTVPADAQEGPATLRVEPADDALLVVVAPSG